MNKLAIYHKAESEYSFVNNMNEAVIRLRMAREDRHLKVKLVYNDNKYKFYLNRYEKEMKVKYQDELFSYFEIKLELEDKRLAYVFKIEDEYYLTDSGLTKEYDFNLTHFDFFQIPYVNKDDMIEVVDFMKNRVFYQIFIDRFNRGNFNKDDSYINKKWSELPKGDSFYGGDLKGITEKLGYIKDLGINALYLTPIFESNSNHKYDTINYEKISKHFGDEKDLKELVKKSHEMDIKIVLDSVLNHCSMHHPFFKDVISKGKDSKYYNWFLIKDSYVDLDKCNYEVFSDVTYMPKFNLENRECKDYLIKVFQKHIIDFDIDGYRLDVADELPHKFLKEFRSKMKEIKKDFVIIGENWRDSRSFLNGDEWDSVMNYALTKAFIDYFSREKIDEESLSNRLNSIIIRYRDNINTMNLNLLDSHDTERSFNLVKKERDTFLSSLAMLFYFVGTPCIYYGTEIALEGKGDPDCRRCLNWDFKEEDIKMQNMIREMIKIRKMDFFENNEIKIYSENNELIIKRYSNNKVLKLVIGRNINFEDENIVLSSKEFKGNGANFKIYII